MSVNVIPPGEEFAPPDLDQLSDYAVHHAPEHLRAVALARQAGKISTEMVFASSRVALLAPDMGTVVTVFDRARVSVGPAGFSKVLLSSLFEICDGLAVIATGPHHPEPYEWAAKVAMHTGGCALIVETTPEFEQAWLDCTYLCRHPKNWLSWGLKARGAA